MTKTTKKRKINTEKLKQPFKRRKKADERVREAFANVPKITNETVAEHREDVLGSARKYIYPLKHSRRRTIIISTTIFVTAVVVFMAYVSVALYKVQSTSGFIYGVTKVIPLPVAKAGDSWVSYNSYLFQLRRYVHYYTTQQEADFNGKDKAQLANYKKQALQQVIDDAYVKQLAKEHDVRISGRAVNQQVQLVRSQNRLGSSDREFREVLNEFWGWDETDFKNSLQQEMLAQAVAVKLDTAATTKANNALAQLKAGADFANTAAQVSEDEATKANGGHYAGAIDPNNSDLPPQVVAQLKKMKVGDYSEVISAANNNGYTLEILKVDSVNDGKIQASHITFNLKSIDEFIKPLKDKNPSKNFIST